MMSGIRSKDTRPELQVRRALFARGWRYRLHGSKLPGKPDLVFASRRAVLFVHGCFWHGHDCHLFRWPGTREAFWRQKIGGNIARDAKVRTALLEAGWRVGVVHECMLKGRTRQPLDTVINACEAFLKGDAPFASIGSDQTVTVSLEA